MRHTARGLQNTDTKSVDDLRRIVMILSLLRHTLQTNPTSTTS